MAVSRQITRMSLSKTKCHIKNICSNESALPCASRSFRKIYKTLLKPDTDDLSSDSYMYQPPPQNKLKYGCNYFWGFRFSDWSEKFDLRHGMV